MSGPRANATGKEPEPDDQPHESDENETLERALAEAKEVVRDLLDLLRIGYDRVRLGARNGGFRLVVLLWVAVAVTTATVVSTYYIVQGLSEMLAGTLGDRPWGGHLASGALVLAAIGVAVLLLRFRARRAELRRLKARYADSLKPSDSGESP